MKKKETKKYFYFDMDDEIDVGGGDICESG